MAIVQKTRLYEALIRWNEDGSVAAHQATITELVDDVTGQVYSAQVNLPTSLVAADVSSVIDATVPGWQSQVDGLNAQITSLQGQIEQAQSNLTTAQQAQQTAEAARDDYKTQLDAANAQIATLTAPPDVPSVSMAQFKLALLATPSLLNAGKTMLDDANALVAGSPMNVQILWSAPRVARDNPVLNQMAPMLVPAPNDPGKVLDQLFVLAAQQQG